MGVEVKIERAEITSPAMVKVFSELFWTVGIGRHGKVMLQTAKRDP
jgi:hypothetical protein